MSGKNMERGQPLGRQRQIGIDRSVGMALEKGARGLRDADARDKIKSLRAPALALLDDAPETRCQPLLLVFPFGRHRRHRPRSIRGGSRRGRAGGEQRRRGGRRARPPPAAEDVANPPRKTVLAGSTRRDEPQILI
jgi:hypothetical protein